MSQQDEDPIADDLAAFAAGQVNELAEDQPLDAFEEPLVNNQIPGAAYPLPSAQERRRASSLNARRTLIPILLTCGTLLCVFGAIKYLVNAESPFSALPLSVILPAFAAGIVLLAVGVFNMLSVRSALRRVSR